MSLFEEEARAALHTCDQQSTQALTEVLRALDALEIDLPPVAHCDREGDARWKAIEALRASFVSAYRTQFAAQRALDFLRTVQAPSS